MEHTWGRREWDSTARWAWHESWSAVPGNAVGKAGASSDLLANSRSCKRQIFTSENQTFVPV